MTDFDLRTMSRQQRDDLINRLQASRRLIEKQIRTARAGLKDFQDQLDALEARCEDIDHSLGYLR